MSLDTLLPIQSGTLFFMESTGILHPEDDKADTYPFLVDILKVTVTYYALPIISLIGTYYNLMLGGLKLCNYFLLLDHHTLYHQNQIRAHFYFFMIDMLTTSSHHIQVIINAMGFLFAKETIDLTKSMQGQIYPHVEKYFIDPRLENKPVK